MEEFRAFLEMIFCFLLKLAGESQCDPLRFTESGGTRCKSFIEENGSEVGLGRIWVGNRRNLPATICFDLMAS